MSKAGSVRTELYNRVWRCIKGNDLQHAVRACEQLNQQYPDYAEGWYSGSVIALKAGNATVALTYIARALAIIPENASWRLHEARCLMAAGKMIDAKRRVDALTSYTINSHSFQSELGELLTTLQDYPAALLAYQKSLDLKPNQPGCHFNMAVLLRFLGLV